MVVNLKIDIGKKKIEKAVKGRKVNFNNVVEEKNVVKRKKST